MEARFRAIQEFKELQRSLITDCLTKRERLNELSEREIEQAQKLKILKQKILRLERLKKNDESNNYYEKSTIRRLDVLDNEQERMSLEKYTELHQQNSLNLKELTSMNELMKLKLQDMNKSLGGANILADTIKQLKRENEVIQNRVTSLQRKLNCDMCYTNELKTELESFYDKELFLQNETDDQTSISLLKTREMQAMIKRLELLKVNETSLLQREKRVTIKKAQHLAIVENLVKQISEKKLKIETHLVRAQKIRLALQRSKLANRKKKKNKLKEKKVRRESRCLRIESVWKKTSTLKAELAELQKHIKRASDEFHKSYQCDTKGVFSILEKMKYVLADCTK